MKTYRMYLSIVEEESGEEVTVLHVPQRTLLEIRNLIDLALPPLTGGIEVKPPIISVLPDKPRKKRRRLLRKPEGFHEKDLEV